MCTDDCGDHVVVTNARQVLVTGRKAEQKLYRHHTMYPGGLKEIPYERMLDRKPDQVRISSDSPRDRVQLCADQGRTPGCMTNNRSSGEP